MRHSLVIATTLSVQSIAVALPGQQPLSVAAERARFFGITTDTVYDIERTGATSSMWSCFGARCRTAHMQVLVLEPTLRFTWNSKIPLSLSDGAMWAGRGGNFLFSSGLRIDGLGGLGPFSLVLAPALVYSQNLPFQVIPDSTPGRSPYSSPFHHDPFSADLPLRFGDRHLLRIDPGGTSLTIRNDRVAAGVTTENEIWGPGIRNQLVLSANATGVPRIFIRTNKPVRTRIGSIEAKLISGVLTESNFFDNVSANDVRSLNGFLLQLKPAFDSTLNLGIERVVYAPIQSTLTGPLGHALDVFLHWDYIAPPGDQTPDGLANQSADQILAFFARWIFPQSGFEVYGEWARMELPKSLSELLAAWYHTGAYTLGFQWARPRSAHEYLRLQSEITYLEQSRALADRARPDFYTGRVSPQGYTQRGQVVGAAIGPGGSSQWIAIDYIAPSWQLGTYIGRIRWENDALYREIIPTLFKHDVTLLTGLRGALRSRWTDLSFEATFGYRFNYLFQNGFANFGRFRTVDVRNLTLSFAATPSR